MIITKIAKKDTFITDLSTSLNQGVSANFGQASTLDLFKIYQENKNVKSRALLIVSNLTDGNTVTIIDSLGVSKTFEYDTGLQADFNGQNTRFISFDSLITEINNVVGFAISAYKLSSTEILLIQDNPGASGDTIITVPEGQASISIKSFKRFEHSAVLINFDLASILDDHISDKEESIFNTDQYKTFITLSDVGAAATSSKDYTLRIRPLNYDFDEGIGRDTLHFSDKGGASFETINKSKNWSVPGFVTDAEVYAGSTYESTFTVVKGNEDVVFDITSYVEHFLSAPAPENKTQTFVIEIAYDNLFDENTYFLKRLGSRNLSYMFNRPKLQVKTKDENFEIVNFDNKKRFLDVKEDFYVTNLINKKLTSFPGEDTHLQMRYEDETISETVLRLLRTPAAGDYLSITNTSGTLTTFGFNTNGSTIDNVVDAARVVNISSFTLTSGTTSLDSLSTLISTADFNVNSSVDNIKKEIKISHSEPTLTQESFVVKNVDANNSIILKENKTNFNIFAATISSTTVSDYKGSTLSGIKKFTVPGPNGATLSTISRFNSSSKFQSDLEKNSKVEIDFKYYVANGGKKYLLKNEKVDFHLPETSEEDLFKKLRVVLDTQQKEISADDAIKTLKFSFIDMARQYKSIKVPFDLVSEDLGMISYKMYDVDTGKTLLENDASFDDTSMFFNGKFYIANLHASKIYKGLRVGFVFEYTDPLTGLKKKIEDRKLIVRFK